jgi:hypothetical protein
VFEIDASEIAHYAETMREKPKVLQASLKKGLDGLLGYGVQVARGFAPRVTGALHAAIKVTRPVTLGATITGEYAAVKSAAAPHVYMREFGGTIVPKRAKYLVFPGRNGGLVFAKSVTQTGVHYFSRSVEVIKPRFQGVVAAAVARAMGG